MISESVIPPELVQALVAKTKSNELRWALTQNGKYSIDLPECTLTLSASDPGAAMPDILFEVDTPDGDVVGVIQVKTGDSEYEEVRQLLISAQAGVGDRLGQILKRAAISIKETAVSTTAMTRTTPPPMPPPPSAEQSRTLFQKIAGEWLLSFSRRGVELLRIDAEGNYYTYPTSRRNEFRLEPTLKYRFTLEHCDPRLEQVELAKRELDGRIRQIEVLALASDSMRGYAKHDAHELVYTRRRLER